MIETAKKPCFTAYVKDNSDFRLLKGIFSDGIPVFEVEKIESKILNESIYVWRISDEHLTDDQREKTYHVFHLLTGWSVEQLKLAPLTIPNEFISMVLDEDLDEVNVKWMYLQQYTAKFLGENKKKVDITIQLGALHLINACFCRMIANEMMTDLLYQELAPLIDSFEEIVVSECPELKDVYNILKSKDADKTIKQLN
jgi:hypothetical protein